MTSSPFARSICNSLSPHRSTKWQRWVFLAAAFLCWTVATRAQLPGSLDSAFNPSVRTTGYVSVFAVQPDGKLVVGGNFYRVGTSASTSLARFNPDGTLDTAFTPPPNLVPVVYVAAGSDGKIVVVENDPQQYATYTLLRLNADGSQDESFAPTTFTGSFDSSELYAFVVSVQFDGKVLVGGKFTDGSGSYIPTVRRFNTDGSRDTGFQGTPGVNITVLNALLPLSNGQILAAGTLYDPNNAANNYRKVYRLNADGSVDESYNPATVSGQAAYALALQPDGKVLYLADDASLPPSNSNVLLRGGVLRRLNADGTADTAFSPQFLTGAAFVALVLQADGKVLVGGYTTNYIAPDPNPFFSQTIIQSGVVRLNADGTTDSSFSSPVALVDEVNALGLLSNGQVIVGGNFSSFGDLHRVGLGRLNADGSVDAGFNNDLTNVGTAYAVAAQPDGRTLLLDSSSLINGTIASSLVSLNANGSVNLPFLFSAFGINPFNQASGPQPQNSVLARQPDGRVLVTGHLTPPDSSGEQYNVARFNLDGSFDTSFFPGYSAYVGSTYAVLPQPDGRIFVAGTAGYGFGEDGLYPLVRLNADGSVDSSLFPASDPGAANYAGGGAIYTLALQPNGQVIAGGTFRPVNGQARAGVVRFNVDGTLDASFQAPAQTADATASIYPSPFVLASVAQPDGKLVVGGHFSALSLAPVGNLARLNVDGSLDTAFNDGGAGANGIVRSIAIQPDGKIVLGGEFTAFNGSLRAGIVRLNPDGSVDSQFDVGTGTAGNGVVNSVSIATDGSVLIAGTFKQFNGQARDGVARLFGGEIPPAPVITSVDMAAGQVGATFSYRIAATNQPTSFGATGLPAGLTLASDTGLISGVPTVAGTFTVTLSVGNLGGTGTANLTLTVAQAHTVITLAASVPQITVNTGEVGVFTLARSGDDLSTELQVAYTVKGSAKNGLDYALLKGVKKIKAGKTSAKIKIRPLGNAGGAGSKRVVTLTLALGEGYTLGTTEKIKVKIFGQ